MAEKDVNKCTQNGMPEDTPTAFAAFPYRVGLTKEEVVGFYSKWAVNGKYEKDLCHANFKGPVIAANALTDYFRGSISQTKVLDVAAGTGLVGKQLQDRGFKHLDALEPAAGMLEQARKKNIYTNLYCEFLDGNRLPIDDDSYDCCVISGGMGEGHIPCCGLHELIRLTKPGGFVCIVMLEKYLTQCKEYMDGLEQLMKDLEDAGKWQRLSRDVVPEYSLGRSGVTFKFRICK
ncbi:methyltransferase-like protein 27 [Haliotis rubra]|uniref:methyltransferase-like protein 27 n=1 Tax=Haliotis rubra TaxID=36100 RepID=UPI001EE590AB|nr:methyltransferase-like protein 27 [Haliotis rubra]